MLLAMNFDGRSILQEKNRMFLDHLLQNKSENRGTRTFVLHVTSQTSVCCVGHMLFKCDQMHLSSAFYRQNLARFTEIYPGIHVTTQLASNGALNKIISLSHDSPPF